MKKKPPNSNVIQNDNNIPKHEIESLARVLLPEIQKYFESDEGKKEFEKWKRQKTEKKTAL